MALRLIRQSIDSNLNDEQKQAVYAPDGPLLVIAGAGSGKTRSLVARIAYLIHRGESPSSIMAVTFTNKAADEMRTRLEKSVGQAAYEVMAGTFHSLANRFLRIYGKQFGIGDYRILDEEEVRSIVTRIVQAAGGEEKDGGKLLSFIHDQKNKGKLPQDLVWDSNIAPEMLDLYRAYQTYLTDHGYMDFDDLIINFNRMMTRTDIRTSIHRRIHHILVDEYQDINTAQYQMVTGLAGDRRNLWAVGDFDQAIYGFRGSDISHILNFQNDYPEARIVRLETNYRSTKTIVDASNHLIERNKKRLPKTLWALAEYGDPIEVVYPANPNQEAAWVADRIQQAIATGTPPSQIAVLYRTHRQAKLIDEALSRRNVPYRIVGQTSFYERQEVKDALSYLRLAVRVDDTEALLRVLNKPRRGFGKRAEETVAAWIDKGWTTEEILTKIGTGIDGSPKSAKMKAAGMELLLTLQSLPTGPAAEAVPEILERSGILSFYENDPDAEKRLPHLERLVEIAQSYGPWLELSEFVDEIRLRYDEMNEEAPDVVQLMTVHAAKGMEFTQVFVIGLNQGIFPIGFNTDLEEERRLFYVAVTRAKKRLILSSPRVIVNRRGFREAMPSTFLSELPEHLLYEVRLAAA